MKKIVNIKRDPVIVDTDTCDIKALPTQCRGIDEVYVVPEDSTIVWEDQFSDDNPTKIDVKKDDILITSKGCLFSQLQNIFYSIVTLYFTFPFIGEESMKKITVNILRQQTATFPVL